MNMRRGKYEKTKSRKNKKPTILIVSLIILLVAIVGGTAAYLWTASEKVTNTFTPAKVTIEPTESVTDTTKSDIKFQNTGNVPVYIRATLAIYWKDKDGNIVPQPVGGQVEGGAVESNWTQVGDIYYYNSQVDPGKWTGVMLSKITVTCPDGYTCHIDVHSEAIQADGWGDGVDTAQEAWAAAKGAQG